MESADKTIGSVVQFFEKLITDFSWRRLGFIAGFLVLIGSALVVYELYTQTFRLARLDREAALLERVLALDRSAQGTTDENLVASLDGLKKRLRDLAHPQPEGTILMPSWLKALYTTIPWVMLSLLVLVSGGSGGRAAILGITVFAVPLIVLNVNLPDFQPQWINHWLIPWGEVLLTVIFVMAWQKRTKKDAV